MSPSIATSSFNCLFGCTFVWYTSFFLFFQINSVFYRTKSNTLSETAEYFILLLRHLLIAFLAALLCSVLLRALQLTATHCNTLQHTATYCDTLQHTTTHCNTPQHTATHCDTPQQTGTN